MSGKFALIIGNTEYIDPGLAQLTAPGKDAEDFARVLKDQEICAFDDVKILLNQSESIVSEAIDEFFDQKKPDNLLVLYFSGHGVRDEFGALYLAVRNTNRFRLRSTAIKSDFIREAMDQSRSKRQVLILDCCNSGAFSQGTKAATGVSIGTASAFEGTGYGRVVLTASDSTQFAWEGDKVIGETDKSLFTHFLIKGLEGEADKNRNGNITVDDLYDYTYEQIVTRTPKQTPGKWSYKQQGEILLRQPTESQREKLRLLELERKKMAEDTEQNVASQIRRKEFEFADNEEALYEKIIQASRLIKLITHPYHRVVRVVHAIDWKIIRRITLAWAISWVISWAILIAVGWMTGWAFVGNIISATESGVSSGYPIEDRDALVIGAIIGAIIGAYIINRLEIKYNFANWKHIFLVALSAVIAGAVGGITGWVISYNFSVSENWVIAVITGVGSLPITVVIVVIFTLVWQVWNHGTQHQSNK